MLGQRAYDHVRDLANLGLIDRRRDGLTRRLTTLVGLLSTSDAQM